MTIFSNQEFRGFRDRDSSRLFSDLEFRNCQFINCAVSMASAPETRTTLQGIRLVGCTQRACFLDAAIVEDSVVEGLRTHDLLQTWGTVFKHVVLRGRMGRIMFSQEISTGTAPLSTQRAFDDANATYYSTVDWALDITDAEVEELDIRGVPARLIRRDPESQVIVTRERAIRGRWREIDETQSYWPTAIRLFLDRGDPELVLVAPKRDRRYRQLRDALIELRAIGVAEPD
jgi:hypothetical protein